jgi:ferredoxin--NADP+ reductase
LYQILQAIDLAPGCRRFEVVAPRIAQKARAGQFIILRVEENGERIPLTIAHKNADEGWISLIFQVVGETTAKLALLDKGDRLQDLVGPLGRPTHITNFGHVVCVGGGIGAAPLYPITCALKETQNDVTFILGARNIDFLILEQELRDICHQLLVTTDDGSYGRHGFVTDALKDLLDNKERPVNLVVAIGPLVMMQAVCNLTREYQTKTMVSLNPIMVDGTGMCGSCRVSVGGQTKFVCVDGPEFDGHKVDFKELKLRQTFYLPEEDLAYRDFKEKMQCQDCKDKNN